MMPRQFNQNSRSFTCLLNEIEEEEKISSDSHLCPGKPINKEDTDTKQRKLIYNKSPSHTQKNLEKEFKRSRNTNNSTVLIGNTNSTIGVGNTIGSVLKSQKQIKDQTNKQKS